MMDQGRRIGHSQVTISQVMLVADTNVSGDVHGDTGYFNCFQ